MSNTSAKIQMYHVGELGDCFLVTFTSEDKTSRLLIDCGSFRNSGESIARMRQIAASIHQEVGDARIDVVVGTHQHNDHLSGFVHAKTEFEQIGIDQVWLSWLDDPKDAEAVAIGEKHNNLVEKLDEARSILEKRLRGRAKSHPRAAHSLGVLDDILGFYGLGAKGVPQIPRQGVDILKSIGKKKPRYLNPGTSIDMPGLDKGDVRIHVLGPPRDRDLLNRKDPRKGESYDHDLAVACLRANQFLDAVTEGSEFTSKKEEHYPFNRGCKSAPAHPSFAPPSRKLKEVIARYKEPSAAWRTIDEDWLTQAEALALYLGDFTNNSSLVLAIELVESGKILLFAADAQTGNWLSWDDIAWKDDKVATADLLARTVFYKVGHHCSHNATLVAGLERMTHPDLVAFIPVDKTDSQITKRGGWKMPAKNLFRRLVEKTEGRVLQMDGVNPSGCDPKNPKVAAAWERIDIVPRLGKKVTEITIKGGD